jgi:hypothetical protein
MQARSHCVAANRSLSFAHWTKGRSHASSVWAHGDVDAWGWDNYWACEEPLPFFCSYRVKRPPAELSNTRRLHQIDTRECGGAAGPSCPACMRLDAWRCQSYQWR